MTKPLDSIITSSLMLQQATRTTIIVDLWTTTPRKITSYPDPVVGGITVGSIVGVLTITLGGSGYVTTAPPAVTFSGGGGQGAAAIAIITAGAVSGFLMLSRGWGYTSAPTIAIAAPPSGTTATATAALGVTYPYQDVVCSPIAESLDGSSVVEASLTIRNTSNAYTDLWLNAANSRAPVSIQKVWRNASDAVAATEMWLEGYTGAPSIDGEHVIIACHADVGRRGEVPRTNWSEVLQTHAAIPPGTTFPWITASQG
jgi:hypothetical protein